MLKYTKKMNKIQTSIQILQEATKELMDKFYLAKKRELEIIREANKKKDEEKIRGIKNKLGI